MREIKFRFWEAEKRKMSKIHGLGVLHEDLSRDFGGYAMWENITIMQYTGLKDKYGKEIYEGDLLNDGTVWKAEVLYEEGSFYAYCRKTNEQDILGNYNLSEVKRIGNKYENPELLEESQDETN